MRPRREVGRRRHMAAHAVGSRLPPPLPPSATEEADSSLLSTAAIALLVH